MDLSNSNSLRSTVICPHCWHEFHPSEVRFIAAHADLIGDEKLGADQAIRFLPTRFSVKGNAIDRKGWECRRIACPDCHLEIPRSQLELKPFFISILGTPSSGKTYFLTSMVWRLRQTLPHHLQLSFSDSDVSMNLRLRDYENQQFHNARPDEIVTLDKTPVYGDHYNSVLRGDQVVNYLKPYLFTIKPLPAHISFAKQRKVGLNLCFYDNSGESFLPAVENALHPVTNHLSVSNAFFFLYDPLQNARFREMCEPYSDDLSLKSSPNHHRHNGTLSQEVILTEAENRVRLLAGLSQSTQWAKPLVVVVTKYDVWKGIFSPHPLPSPYLPNDKEEYNALNISLLQVYSQKLRRLLLEFAPEVVAAAEQLSSKVFYVPVSATGCSSEFDPDKQAWGIRPRNIRPQWVAVPLLYLLSQYCGGLVRYYKESQSPSPLAPGNDKMTPSSKWRGEFDSSETVNDRSTITGEVSLPPFNQPSGPEERKSPYWN